MNYIISTLLVTILLFGGCRSSGKTQDSADSNITEESKSLKVLAKEKLGEGVKMESNSIGDLVLCTNKTLSNGSSFFVFDKTANSILLERNGFIQYVRWHTDSTLLYKTKSTNPTTDKTNAEKVINVFTGEELRLDKSR